MAKKLIVELIGTFWLVLGGCGSAVLAAGFPVMGIGYLGVAIAFGLTLVSMISALGHISGGHFNPAVTVGLATAGRFPGREIFPYVIAQVVGAIAASWVLYEIASGRADFTLANGFAANGYGAYSPGNYSLSAALLCEIVTTAAFVLVIIGVTSKRAFVALAPFAIGLALTLIHLLSIPVTNTSVNPARSTGPALIVGGWALQQLWLFWVAPLVGALIGGSIGKALIAEEPTSASTTLGPVGREEGPSTGRSQQAANF